MTRTPEEKRAWTAGFGIACSELATSQGEGLLAAHLIRDAGLTLELFVEAGLDDDDIASLRAAMSELEQEA